MAGVIKGRIILILMFFAVPVFFHCGTDKKALLASQGDISEDSLQVNVYEWEGDARSKEVATKVLQELGGRRRWANLSALYIRYLQFDNEFASYPSIQYQSLTDDRIVVDQFIKDRRFIRILDHDLAWIINDGELTEMDETNRRFLIYWHHLDYYWNIHRFAIGKGLRVLFSDTSRNLFVMEKDKFVFALHLDENFVPVIFQRPKFNEQNISLRFTAWETEGALLYPSRGEAVESEFKFEVEEIDFSAKNVDEAFEISVNPDYIYDRYEFGLESGGE